MLRRVLPFARLKMYGKRIKQINNLVIYYNQYCKYAVWHNGICYEEFTALEQAENFCRNTKDFIVKNKKEN